MNDPVCAICGEKRLSSLRVFNYGVCLCHRCNDIAAHAFIKMHTDNKLRERKEETKEEYMERVDRERREKEFHEVIEQLNREWAEKDKAEQDRITEKKLRELRERNAKAARAAIKFAIGTHEALRGRCSCCGKSVPRNELRRYNRGKYYEIFPATLCPACFKGKNMEYDLLVSDQSLKEAQRAMNDLKEEYEDFRERTSRVWWGMGIAGVVIGSLFTLMFLNPK